MNKLVILKRAQANKLLNTRKNESKFGEHVHLLTNITNIYETIKNLDVKYVVFGIPEDIGVFANLGKTGTKSTWDATIKVLLNIQSNIFTNPKDVLILGYLDFNEALTKVLTLKNTRSRDLKTARNLVEQIDKEVTQLVHTIVKAGKTPIIIGGGHNNAYGNIKGTSLALNKPINAINFDAHTDFRTQEGRHSGNGFSYAFAEGFLEKYFVFGLHENYTSHDIFNTLNSNENLEFNTYEAIEVRKELNFKVALQRAKKHITNKPFGIEIDCDAIENINSSAKTPSGFSVQKTRQFLHYFGKRKNVKYLHICEASATKKDASKIGKLITYFITDFIKANAN